MKHDVFLEMCHQANNWTLPNVVFQLVDEMNWNEISSTLYNYNKRFIDALFQKISIVNTF